MNHVQRKKVTVHEKPKDARKTLLRLFSYLLGQKGLLSIVFALILISIASSIGASYLLRPIINDYIIPGDISGLSKILIILGLVYLLGVISSLFQYRILNKVGQNTVAVLRKELFDKMEILPIRFFDIHQHGELMSRYTNDVDKISDALTDSIAELLTSIITLVGILIFMIYISPILTLITLIIIPLMFLIAGKIIKKSRKYFKEQQQAIGDTNGYIEEIISGQKVVKSFSHEEIVEKEFNSYNNNLKEKSEKAQLYSGMMMPMMQNMNTLSFVLITIVGSLLVIFRGFDLGGLAAFLQYSRQFGRPINQLANQYNSLQAAIAGAERIFQIIDEIPENANDTGISSIDPKTTKGEVVFKDVHFSYTPTESVLKGISLNIKPGDKVAFVGSTGAGKTTIFNMLPRFYDIQSGEILIDNIPINKIPRSDLRKSMAVVLQDTHLFAGSVMENIRYGNLDATDEEVINAAKLSAAHSFIKRLPQGYQTILTEDAGNLSQGQRQLLSIARAAIVNPTILLLDEATSSVDTRTEMLIQTGMDRLMQGRTSFVIAHRLSTVKNADKIVVLEKGKIVEEGKHEELLSKKGRYYDLYKGQFE